MIQRVKNREFKNLSLDDVSLEGTDYDFYTSDTVFNTNLEGYNLTSTDQSDVNEDDTPLTA